MSNIKFFGVGKVFLLFLLLLQPICSFSQRVTATIHLDSLNYSIGGNIGVKVSIEHPADVKVQWAQSALQLDNFQKTSESKIDTVKTSGYIVENRTINLTTFDTGIIQIPALAFNYTKANGEEDTAMSNNLMVTVSTIDVDTSKGFRDIKPPLIAQATKQSNYIAYAMTASIVLTIAIILFYLFGMKKKPGKKNGKAALKSLHRLTLDKLEALEKEKAWMKNTEQYYVQLTFILREYIEAKFSIDALENTSIEIIHFLKKKITDEKILHWLSNDLALADLVKFANVAPTEKENESVLHSAIDFVNSTQSKNVHNDL